MITRQIKDQPLTVTMEFVIAAVPGHRPIIGRSEEDRRLAEAYFAKFMKLIRVGQQKVLQEDAARSSGGSMRKTLHEFKEREKLETANRKNDVFSKEFAQVKYSKDSDEYGKPVPGTLTDIRAKKAAKHIAKEMITLCEIIEEYGIKKGEKTLITFGELFKTYEFISDKVVGMLLRARKHKMVDFEGEMLFQRRDEEKTITLLLTREQIKNMIDELRLR